MTNEDKPSSIRNLREALDPVRGLMNQQDQMERFNWFLFYTLKNLGLIRRNPYYAFSYYEYDDFMVRLMRIKHDNET